MNPHEQLTEIEAIAIVKSVHASGGDGLVRLESDRRPIASQLLFDLIKRELVSHIRIRLRGKKRYAGHL